MENILYIIAFFILIDVVFAYFIFFRRKRLSKKFIMVVARQIRRSKEKNSFNEIIMDLDKIMDNILKQYGYKGSFADKLKKSESLFSDYNGIWSAHKLRNKVAHESGYSVSASELRRALSCYDKAFRDLGVL